MQSIGQHLMPIFVGSYHFLDNLLDVLLGCLYCTIHLRPIRRRIMMFDLEFFTKSLHHIVVQVGTIVGNDLAGNTISTDDVVPDELGYHLLGNIGIRCRFNQFGEVVNCH
ncbi:hypothetical protein MtrunA17_Chr7g0226171 [Medicago truncatula]|uniref:Uncharacterized protein n=1 Tax=Medicago truncatula TaxID=3880 RepID=A0A396GVK3_MEDTR|nr:hypothetical protein MtrunA17_Chr7g0226171 [Medicago truncatula]